MYYNSLLYLYLMFNDRAGMTQIPHYIHVFDDWSEFLNPCGTTILLDDKTAKRATQALCKLDIIKRGGSDKQSNGFFILLSYKCRTAINLNDIERLIYS